MPKKKKRETMKPQFLRLTGPLVTALEQYCQEHNVKKAEAIEEILWKNQGIKNAAKSAGVERSERVSMGRPAKESKGK